MSVEENNKAIILITGASSGLGACCALLAAQKGYIVFAGVRNILQFTGSELAKKFSNLNINIVSLDVCNKDSAEAVVAHILENYKRIDVAICNAGISIEGTLEDTPVDEIHKIMDTNFYGCMRVVQSVLPSMRAHKAGHIIAISSLSALIGLPGEGAYAASKFALEGAIEALCIEIEKFGIQTTLAIPGAFKTKLAEKTKLPDGFPVHTAYDQLHAHFIEQKAKSSGGANPADAAYEIIDLIANPPYHLRVPIGEQAKLVINKLEGLSAEERHTFALEITDTHWWAKSK